MSILLNSGSCHFVSSSIVAKMNDLATLALEDPPENSNGRIMSIEDGGRGDYSEWHSCICHALRTPLPDMKPSEGQIRQQSPDWRYN
jgi:hypothetical protein